MPTLTILNILMIPLIVYEGKKIIHCQQEEIDMQQLANLGLSATAFSLAPNFVFKIGANILLYFESRILDEPCQLISINNLF